MSGRFNFTHAYDPHMHTEDAITLARTATKTNTLPKANGQVKSAGTSPQQSMASPPYNSSRTAPHSPAQRKNYVFTDPVAFRYLEEDPATVVLERRRELKGYEIYLVEQWACSRVHPTFIIATYTGDPNHSVLVGVLGIPAKEEDWSPRLSVYFKAILHFQAKPKDTPLGTLMVTNLGGFPSALTVIPIPDGDVRKHREDFIVNENLKRLGCSGRSGLTIAYPSGATQAKFLQLYKTSDRIPLYGAVIELVKLCQVALMMFGHLEQEYADGIFCDVTEKAIGDWWTEIGSEYYNIEPADGILGPTTVAALLGMLMGARNRLNYLGGPVSKDTFDIIALKRGIGWFQKYHKLERTRRLDRQTLNRLQQVTAKAAAGEGWAVPKAVKSTVVELSGKGGEMVMGMVGRDKAGIGDIETLDIDRFVNLVHGERAKWLWHGKPRRTGGDSRVEPDTNLSFTKDENGGYLWSHSRSDSLQPDDDIEPRRKEKDSPHEVYSSPPPGSTASIFDDRDEKLRKTVFKSVTGKMNDARSGFGRIKDAVGLRGHTSNKHSKDESSDGDGRGPGHSLSPQSSSTFAPSSAVPASPTAPAKSFTWKDTPKNYQNGSPRVRDNQVGVASPPRLRGSESPPSASKMKLPYEPIPRVTVSTEDETNSRWVEQVKDIRATLVAKEPSINGSVYDDGDLEGPVLEADRDPKSFQVLLHRRHSISTTSPEVTSRDESWWPRSMSFSYAEDAVLGWEEIGTISDEADASDPWITLQRQKLISQDFRFLFEKVSNLKDHVSPWVDSKINSVERLDDEATRDQDTFQTLYYRLSESYQAVKHNSQGILADERSSVTETLKEIEVLAAKLEYEVNSLISKVQDVEDGVSQFQRQVDDLEGRADELETHLNRESYLQWMCRSVMGICTRLSHPAQGRQ